MSVLRKVKECNNITSEGDQMTILQPYSHHNHNHSRCIDTALEAATLYCQKQGEKFSSMREAVFKAVWNSHQPIGAYDILEYLSKLNPSKRLAPPTVYRALDFLIEHRLIHRINSLNAFIGCSEPGCHPNSHFLICQNCRTAIELDEKTFEAPLQKISSEYQFTGVTAHLELIGLCPSCQHQVTP